MSLFVPCIVLCECDVVVVIMQAKIFAKSPIWVEVRRSLLPKALVEILDIRCEFMNYKCVAMLACMAVSRHSLLVVFQINELYLPRTRRSASLSISAQVLRSGKLTALFLAWNIIALE